MLKILGQKCVAKNRHQLVYLLVENSVKDELIGLYPRLACGGIVA